MKKIAPKPTCLSIKSSQNQHYFNLVILVLVNFQKSPKQAKIISPSLESREKKTTRSFSFSIHAASEEVIRPVNLLIKTTMFHFNAISVFCSVFFWWGRGGGLIKCVVSIAFLSKDSRGFPKHLFSIYNIYLKMHIDKQHHTRILNYFSMAYIIMQFAFSFSIFNKTTLKILTLFS